MRALLESITLAKSTDSKAIVTALEKWKNTEGEIPFGFRDWDHQMGKPAVIVGVKKQIRIAWKSTGQWHRHVGGDVVASLRSLRAGRRHDDPALRRLRLRARHHEAPMGGAVSSTVRVGSVFSVQLPHRLTEVAPGDTEIIERSSSASRAGPEGLAIDRLRGIRVLVVEDGEVNQLVLRHARSGGGDGRRRAGWARRHLTLRRRRGGTGTRHHPDGRDDAWHRRL
jgi:hypothetical protein